MQSLDSETVQHTGWNCWLPERRNLTVAIPKSSTCAGEMVLPDQVQPMGEHELSGHWVTNGFPETGSVMRAALSQPCFTKIMKIYPCTMDDQRHTHGLGCIGRLSVRGVELGLEPI